MTIKRFFVYSGLVCYFFSLFSMQQNSSIADSVDTEVNRILELIDQKHLNAYQDDWAIVRKFYHFCDAISLTDQQVEGEMVLIESYISAHVDKEIVLQKLAQRHWYVDYLMKSLINKKISAFDEVTGSQIDSLYDCIMDALYYQADTTFVETIVYKHVFEHYFHTLDGNSLDAISQEMRGLYFTVLKGFDQIEPSSLAISTNNKYLRVTDYNKADIIWDTLSGNLITDEFKLFKLKHMKKVAWIPAERDKDFWGYDQKGEQYSISGQNYYATIKNLPILDMMGQSSSHIGCESKVITLFKKPEMPLYFYQKAFENSKNSLPELRALLDSKNLVDIKGFPQENLKQCIAKRIEQLTLESRK